MLFEKITYQDDFPINITIASIEEYPLHYHQDIEFVYVLKGEVTLKNGYCHYTLKEGDIFTNAGHEVHSLTSTGKENIVALIQISTHYFSQYFPSLSKACYPGVRHLCSPKRSSLTLQPIGKWAFFMKLFVKFEYFLCCNCCIFILNVI